MVLDILQNCAGSIAEARQQILMMFGKGESQPKPFPVEEPLNGDSWGEIPEIVDLDKEIKVQQNSQRNFPENKHNEHLFRDETTEHINNVLYGGQNEPGNRNHLTSEKDPPHRAKPNKKGKKKRKRQKKKRRFIQEQDDEEELIYDNLKRGKQEASIAETLSNETRESLSKQLDDFKSDLSSLNFSRILDDLEGPEMTNREKEEILQMMKTDYKESWDKHDQNSFMDAYLDSQMVEDIVSALACVTQGKSPEVHIRGDPARKGAEHFKREKS